MLPRYFHYIEPADPLNRVIDRFIHGNSNRLVFLLLNAMFAKVTPKANETAARP